MSDNEKRTKETITLGSGKLYFKEWDGADLEEIPEEIINDNNLLGLIKGGAALVYEQSPYEAKDDLGKVKKTIITEETAKITSGIMTWNARTLEYLTSTGRVTEDKTKGKRTIKIGGLGNQSRKSYIIVFVHEDKEDGNVKVMIVGKNTVGITLTFAKDTETVIDTEFAAEPLDRRRNSYNLRRRNNEKRIRYVLINTNKTAFKGIWRLVFMKGKQKYV